MKRIKVLLLFALPLLSCSTKVVPEQKDSPIKTTTLELSCPENIDCSFEILKNKSMDIKTDETGALYYEMVDNPEKVVYSYQYKQKNDNNLQDAFYREEIVFEMDKNHSDFSFSNDELQTKNMLFGVFCYCKGKAGYYKVKKGSISKKDKILHIEIPEIVEGQKVNKLDIHL